MTTDTDSLIGADALAMVGQETGRTAGLVSRNEFQRWAAAVGDLNPLYFDDDYARDRGYREACMPPMYLSQIGHGVAHLDQMRPDGIPEGPGGGSVPLPKAPRRMAGGESTEYLLPIYDGDVITGVRTIESIVEKHGRSGRFVLVGSRAIYINQNNETVARTSGSMIARP